MVNFNNFKQYKPDNAINGVAYIQSDDGIDWYDSQKEFSPKTIKICFNSAGTIVSVSNDVSMLFPLNLSIAEVDALPDNFELNEFKYKRGKVVRIKNDNEIIIENNTAKKKLLIEEVTPRLTLLQSKLILNKINSTEKEELGLLVDYVDNINLVDIENKDAEWPQKPE